jgi:hypothetical protein
MKPNAKRALISLGLTLFVYVFGIVYHQFSHGVISNDMAMAWVPLAVATGIYFFVWLIIPAVSKRPYYRLSVNLLNAATAWQTLGMILQAVIDIAGSSSPYLIAYPYVALALYGLSGLSVVLWLIKPKSKPSLKNPE